MCVRKSIYFYKIKSINIGQDFIYDRVHNTVSNCGVILTSFYLVPTTILISIILPIIANEKIEVSKD